MTTNFVMSVVPGFMTGGKGVLIGAPVNVGADLTPPNTSVARPLPSPRTGGVCVVPVLATEPSAGVSAVGTLKDSVCMAG